MIERIRDGLWYLKLRFFSRERKRRRLPKASTPCLKGSMRPVIVIKPDNAMFEQAMFFLSEEYMRAQDKSAEMLLAQAREAAAEYLSQRPELLKSGRGAGWLWLLIPAAAAAAAGLYIWLF